MATSEYKKKVKDVRQEREKKLVLKHKFDTRITNVKHGKEAFAAGDFIGAIRKYTDYFETLAELHRVRSIYELHPGHFDKQKDLTEIMMMSHLYFDLARVYDATGKFTEDVTKCLDQFVLFTANQPYQVVNSEMCRKHLRKYRFKNHDLFIRAYQQIFVQSRKCFIASFSLGEEHPTTQDLRRLKTWMLERHLFELVRCYYVISTWTLTRLEKHPLLARWTQMISAPCLKWFSRRVLPHIIKK